MTQNPRVFADNDEHQALVLANQLTDAELERFYFEVSRQPAKRAPVPGQVVRLGFELMEDAGLRITELLHVKKQDIDFQTRIITVTHPKSESQCKCSVWRYADLYSRRRVLESSDPNCIKCHGKGKWKKPQFATFTPRIEFDLQRYCEQLIDEDLLFLGSRKTWWQWGKQAGIDAGINIFQQKKEKTIKGIFNHLFRQLCSKRMTRDAKTDPYHLGLVDLKMRHSIDLRATYNRPDINYLLAWEQKTYVSIGEKLESMY